MSWRRETPVGRRGPERVGTARLVARALFWLIRTTLRVLRGRVRYLVFLVAVSATIALVLTSPTFRVRHVQVYGVLLLHRRTVERAANLTGANPFLVDTAAVEKRVLALGVPERARVSFILPDTAVIDLSERTPDYLWKVGTTLYLVSRDGTVLGTTPRENGRVLVVDLDGTPLTIGERVDPGVLAEAAYLMAVLPRVAGLSPGYLLHARDLGMIVPTPDGFNVAIGDSHSLDAKLRVLGPTLRAALVQRPRPTLIDLRFPGHPYFR